VLLTGANLSEDYFTDRQDRCYILHDCQHVGDYFEDLLQILTDCSYCLNDDGELAVPPFYPHPFKSPKKFKNQLNHHLKFFRFSNRSNIEKTQDLQIDDFFEDQAASGPDGATH